MATPGIESELLLGTLAHLLGFIDRESFLAAMNALSLDPARPLGAVLVSTAGLDPESLEGLRPTMEALVRQNEGSVSRCLAALALGPETASALSAIQNPAVSSTIRATMNEAVGIETVAPSVTGPWASPGAPGAARDRAASARHAAGPESVAEDAPANRSAKRFRVIRPHAKGGLGIVYLAHDRELNREVALKEILDHHADDPGNRARFLAEAQITGGLEHPGIVPVYGLGAYPDGRPFYGMRFIQGDSLRDAISAFHERDYDLDHRPGERSLEFQKLLRRFLDVCNAIDYAHSRGVLHRDLKPSNIMVGKYGETLVVDWGLAKPVGPAAQGHRHGAMPERLLTTSVGDATETRSDARVGTPAFMSPEQAAGRNDLVGYPSDIYGLGATLYVLLTGRPAFVDRDVLSVLRQVERGEFPRPSRVKPRTPRPLEEVCLKAMAVRPTDRYASARALADDIERWLADEPVTAWPEPWPLRLRRWMRRHRALVTSSAAGLIIALAALGAIATVLVTKNRQLDMKNVELDRTNDRLDARNIELIESNRQISEQRQRAEDRERLAIEAVKEFRDAVAESPDLKGREDLKPLRDALLGRPLGFFQSLRDRLQSDQSTRPETIISLAMANADLARTTADIGRMADAVPSYREAIRLIEGRLAKATDLDPVHGLAAVVYNNLGNVLNELGHVDEALQAYQSALSIRSQALVAGADDLDSRRGRAVALNNVGLLLFRKGRLEEAIQSLRQALELREALAAECPEMPAFQASVASTLAKLGLAEAARGRHQEALHAYREGEAILRPLVAAHPNDNDAASELGQIKLNRGALLFNLGQRQQALSELREADSRLERLVQENPGVNAYQDDLAKARNNQAVALLSTGRHDEALAMFRSAISVRERQVREQPTMGAYRNHLATSLENLGLLLIELRNHEEAIATFKRAIASFEALAARSPAPHIELARALSHLGHAELRAGRLDEARASLDRARVELTGVEPSGPTSPLARSIAGLVHHNLGAVYRELHQPGPALDCFTRALDFRERLVKEGPDLPAARQALADTLRELGGVALDQDAPSRAQSWFEEAVQQRLTLLRAQPDNPAHRESLAQARFELAQAYLVGGAPRDAARVARDLASFPTSGPDDLYNAACLLALCAPRFSDRDDADACAKDAVAALRRAIAAGWADADWLIHDADLASLHDRADYRRAIDELFDLGWPPLPFAR